MLIQGVLDVVGIFVKDVAACESTCLRCPSWNGGGTGSTSKKSDNSWIWILVVVGIGVGGYFLYNCTSQQKVDNYKY